MCAYVLQRILKGHTTDFFITPLESFLVAEFEIDFFLFWPLLDPGFVELKDNRAPPPPTDFCKNYLYEGIDLETWNLACDTLVPSLVQEKYDPPGPPLPCHF